MSSVLTPSDAFSASQEEPTHKWSVTRLTRLDELRELAPAWTALAARSLEQNVFYEPWVMLPALEHFHSNIAIECYAVFLETGSQRRLAALVPFERPRLLGVVPQPWRRLLRYYYCGLCTPLVDRECAPRALQQLFAELKRRGGLFEFDFIHADGPFAAALETAAAEFDAPIRTSGAISRALLRPKASARAYMDATFSPKKQRELQRLERRLREQGEVSYDTLAPDDPVDQWIEEFLELESRGWKGERSSALASVPGGASFFRRLCREAHARGRLEMHALRLNGRPLSHLCLFSAGRGLYAFRTAYDEEYARYSPGTLLCVWHSRQVHARPELAWVDSCASPNSQLDNRLWQERLRIANVRISLGVAGWLLHAMTRTRLMLSRNAATT